MRALMRNLEENGQLLTINRQVDPKYELPAITHKIQETTNQAALFTDVKGTRLPVVTNIYGNRERIAAIISAEPRNFCRAWTGLMGLPGVFPDTIEFTSASPEFQHGALSELPLVWYSERDGGAYFTSAIYLARDPEARIANLSFHRSMYINDRELRVRLAPRHDLARYQEKAEALGKPLDAAILIGVSPQVFLAAAARLPHDQSEISLAARLAGKAIPMRSCTSIDLEVPADTEVVIEGRFIPHLRRPEGPFGEFMDYYVEVAENPVFEVLDVYWRNDAVFHSINCGSAEEVVTLAALAAARTYEHLSATVPGVLDVIYHPFVNHTVIKLEQQYDGHSREALLAVMAKPISCKMCTVVDQDVDIYDLRDVIWAVLTRAQPKNGITKLSPVPSFHRDPQSHWGRIAIDACAPYDSRDQFIRKRIPGADQIVISDYTEG